MKGDVIIFNIIDLNSKLLKDINDFDIIDLRNINYVNTSGNLIKFIFEPKDGRRNHLHIKTGKLIGGKTPETLKFGIEPLVELLSYKLCKLMNLDVANERLNLALIRYRNKEFLTIVNISEDFRDKQFDGNRYKNVYDFLDFKYLKEELIETDKKMNYKEIISTFKILKEKGEINIDIKDSEMKIFQMILFDYIILNTDRHYQNFGYLRKKSNQCLEFSPIYDNGQSLLYDIDWDKINISDTKFYESSLQTIQLNNYFYKSLLTAEQLIYKTITIFGNSKEEIQSFFDYELKINLNFTEEELANIIEEVYISYSNLLKILEIRNKPNNIIFKITKLNKNWFTFMEYMVYNRTANILNGFNGKYDN